MSLYKPRVHTKDNVPHECVDEPVHREILACATLGANEVCNVIFPLHILYRNKIIKKYEIKNKLFYY